MWNKVLLNTLYAENPDNTDNTDDISKPDRNRINQGHDALTKLIGWQINGKPKNITYQTNTPMTNRHQLNLIDVPFSTPKAGIDTADTWVTAGRKRYDTILVRYIEWFVHCQRAMRLLMREQLDWVNDPIAHKSNAISKEITEYDSNKKFEMSDFE